MIIKPENTVVYDFYNFFFRFKAIFFYPFGDNGIYSVQIKCHDIFSFVFRIFENIQNRVKNIIEKFFISFFFQKTSNEVSTISAVDFLMAMVELISWFSRRCDTQVRL